MTRWVSVIWALQSLALLVIGVFWLVAPEFATTQLMGATPPPLAVVATRLLAPFIVAMGLFTALGIMSSERMLRRHFAGLFALFLLPWVGVVGYNLRARWLITHEIRPSSWNFLGVGVTFLIIAVATFFGYSTPDESTTGYRTTAPPRLWPFWWVQTGLLVAVSVGLLVAPDRVLCGFLRPAACAALHADRLADVDTAGQFRLFMPYLLSLALFNLYGLGRTGWVEIWGSIARILGFALGLAAVSALIAYRDDVFVPWTLAAVGVLAWFAYQNLSLATQVRRDGLQDMGPPPAGWTVLDLVAGPMMFLQTLTTKRRASHLVGVGARGTFVAQPDARVPASAFFQPGARFPLQVRFANLTMRDDASLDVRGASMKLSLDPLLSPFDMVFNTGSFCPARNVVEFAQFVASKFLPTFGSALIVRNNLRAREGGIAGLRRAPSSFLALRYHSQIVRGWTDTRRQSYLVRYRLIGEGAESGLPDEQDCAHIWLRERRVGEPRPPTYLRQELVRRLAEGPAQLRLQAQFHPYSESEQAGWYNAGEDWDELERPWLDVGVLTLEQSLSDRATELLRFNPWNQPESLFTPRSVGGWLDFRSLGDSEARVMNRLQKLRLALYRMLGMPRFQDGGGS